MKTKVYIVGKVSGLPFREVKTKFDLVHTVLQDAGFEPVNPLNVVTDTRCRWNPAMRKCIAALMQCDALFLIHDVEDSPGAQLEMELATRLSIPMFRSMQSLRKHFKPFEPSSYGFE